MNKRQRFFLRFFCLLGVVFLADAPALAQPTAGSWVQKASMGAGRFWSFSFGLAGKVYGGTGRPEFSAQTPLSDFWEFDPGTDTWSQKADYPGGNREGATGFTAMDRGFAGFGSPFIQFSKDLYEYFPLTNTWEARASVPGIGFAFSHGFVIDSVYYIGPENGTNQVFAYHILTDSWTTVADFPGNDRRAQVSFSLLGKGYIGMGAGVFSGVYGDFWAYDPLTDSWSEIAEISPRSDQSTAFAIGNYGYVQNAGGSGGGGKSTYRYDPINDIWEFDTSMPGDRIANGTSCSLDSLAYLLFGERTISGGNLSSDQVWEFTPGKAGTSMGIQPSLFQPRVQLLPVSEGIFRAHVSNIPPGPTSLLLSDLGGKRISRTNRSMPESIEIPLGPLASGIYLFSIEQAGQIIYAGKWLNP